MILVKNMKIKQMMIVLTILIKIYQLMPIMI